MIYREEKTIVDVAQQRALQHGERNFVTFLEDGDEKEVKLSYAELDQSARQMAGWLQAQGIGKGERAIILLPNGLEFVQVFFGCLYAGVLAVPLSHQLGSYRETLLPNLRITQPRIIMSTLQISEFLRSRLSSEIDSAEAVSIMSDREILAQKGYPYSDPQLNPADPAYLQFSSGSTGAPKGVIVGHSNIMANMEQGRIFGQWEEEKGTSLWLPLFHDFGLAAGLIGSLYSGGFVVLMTPVHFILKPSRWLQAMSAYRCAYSYAPPFAFDMCLRKIPPEELEGLDLSSMISIVIGAEPVHYEATKRFNDFFARYGLAPDVVRPGFGMAETVIMFSESPKLEVLCADRHLLETEGKLKLVDESTPRGEKKYLVNLGPDMQGHKIVIMGQNGAPLPEGEVGEITLTGPSVCMGYYKNPEATEETFGQRIEGYDTPFLRTGDVGLLWEGNLYFSGRIKDIIIIRGRNYYPHDIEFAVGKVDEVNPDSVVAYPIIDDEQDERLALGIEISGDYLSDIDHFKNELLPDIDRRVIKTVGDYFQIHPSVRLYLRPGTVKKTSSGKIKHSAMIDVFKQPEFNGLLARMADLDENMEDTAELDVRETILALFRRILEQDPVLDEALVDIGSDSLKIVEFVEAVEERYPIPDFELLDHIDETTTLEELIEIVEDRNIQNLIPI